MWKSRARCTYLLAPPARATIPAPPPADGTRSVPATIAYPALPHCGPLLIRRLGATQLRRIIRLGPVGQVAPQELGLVDLHHKISRNLQAATRFPWSGNRPETRGEIRQRRRASSGS